MSSLKKKLAGKRAVKEGQINLEEIAALIKAGSVKKVVICAGAGISSMSIRYGKEHLLTEVSISRYSGLPQSEDWSVPQLGQVQTRLPGTSL